MAQISSSFIDHISKQLPKNTELEAFLDACQRPLRRSIRANTLKATADHLRQELEQNGYSLTPIPWCDEGFWIDESHKPLPENLGSWLPHLQGKLYIQEASSMLPVKALLDGLNYSEHATFLDMAAAPGSKTTQLAAQINDRGMIIANELSSSRLKGLHYNIQRCGITNTALSHADGRAFGDSATEYFDAILLDAPCGGEGTVRKDEQALSNWSLDKVLSISALQKELIVSAYHALKPGGRLVYSTCTLSQEENQNVCQHLLEQFPDTIKIKPLNDLFKSADKAVTEDGYLHVFPNTYDCEGFFVACFEKLETQDKKPFINTEAKPFRTKKFTSITRKAFEELQNYSLNFGWSLDTLRDSLFCKSLRNGSEEVWLLHPQMLEFNNLSKLNRFGLKLFELNKHGPKIQHQAIISFGRLFTKQVIALNSSQAQEYYQGKDIFLEKPLLEKTSEPPKHKEVIVTYNDSPLGLAKHLGKKLKNNLPRELVRDTAFSVLN